MPLEHDEDSTDVIGDISAVLVTLTNHAMATRKYQFCQRIFEELQG